jgi:hypothetical protein
MAMTTMHNTATVSTAGAADTPLRELAQRTAGGVEVTLLWNRHDNSLIVSMWNPAQGAYLQFDAEPHTARDAFNHPYPYAAAKGLHSEEIFLAA